MHRLISLAAAVALPITSAAAGQLRVPSQYATITDALAAASALDEILVAPGDYSGVDAAIDFSGKGGIRVIGDGPPGSVRIIGGDAPVGWRYALGSPASSQIRFENLVFRARAADTASTDVGFLWVDGSVASNLVVLLFDCVFEDNASDVGAAVTVTEARVDALRTLFRRNTARLDGGAIRVEGSAILTLEECSFEDNHSLGATALGGADGGGGALSLAGFSETSVVRCTFQRNSAARVGGAIRTEADAFLSVISASFYRSASTQGGATIHTEGATSLTQILVAGSTGGAAGVVFTRLPNAVASSTFVAGIGQDLSGPTGTSDFVYNSVFTSSVPPTVADPANFNLIAPSAALAALFEDPLGQDGVSATADEDFTPASASPLLDAASFFLLSADAADLDQDGLFFEKLPLDLADRPRVQDDPSAPNATDPPPDIGALERQPAPVCPADITGDGVVNFADVSAFVTAFAAQQPAADITGDGSINFADVSAFIAAFNSGC